MNYHTHDNKKPVIQENLAARGIPLSSLTGGTSATVLSVRTGTDIVGQLMGMGLFAGSKVSILQKGLTDQKPILVAVGDTRIAISHQYANLIFVEKD